MKNIKILFAAFLTAVFTPSCTKTYVYPLVLDYEAPASSAPERGIPAALVLNESRGPEDYMVFIDDIIAEKYGPDFQVHHKFGRYFNPLIKTAAVKDLKAILAAKGIDVTGVYRYKADMTPEDKKRVKFIVIPAVDFYPVVWNIMEVMPGFISDAVLGSDGSMFMRISMDVYFLDPVTGETLIHKRAETVTEQARYYGGDEAVDIAVEMVNRAYPEIMKIIDEAINPGELKIAG